MRRPVFRVFTARPRGGQTRMLKMRALYGPCAAYCPSPLRRVVRPVRRGVSFALSRAHANHAVCPDVLLNRVLAPRLRARNGLVGAPGDGWHAWVGLAARFGAAFLENLALSVRIDGWCCNSSWCGVYGSICSFVMRLQNRKRTFLGLYLSVQSSAMLDKLHFAYSTGRNRTMSVTPFLNFTVHC